MEKLKELLANFHQSPVKTVLGTLGAAATWISLRPEIGHPTLQGVGAMALAAILFLWGGVSQDTAK